jgi:pimeloyl-ACP methyl ester carboxylesterase
MRNTLALGLALGVTGCGVLNFATGGEFQSPFAPGLPVEGECEGDPCECDGECGDEGEGEGEGEGEVVTETCGGELSTFTTGDVVDLQADFYTNDAAANAVILVHESPSLAGGSRANWGCAFIEKLRDRGLAVLVFDRRGAGDSGPGDADGPDGVFDVAAAFEHLVIERGYDEETIGLVGASTGTTSVFDFVVTPGSPLVATVVFLSAGAWTGASHPPEGNPVAQFVDASALLALVTTLLMYGEADSETADVVQWHVDVESLEISMIWFFDGVPGVASHGTHLVNDDPAVADFVAQHLADRIILP